MTFIELCTRLLNRLRRLPESGATTESALARRLGMSQSHLHNTLKGVRGLTIAMADQIMKSMNWSLCDLLEDLEVKEESARRKIPKSKGRELTVRSLSHPGSVLASLLDFRIFVPRILLAQITEPALLSVDAATDTGGLVDAGDILLADLACSRNEPFLADAVYLFLLEGRKGLHCDPSITEELRPPVQALALLSEAQQIQSGDLPIGQGLNASCGLYVNSLQEDPSIFQELRRTQKNKYGFLTGSLDAVARKTQHAHAEGEGGVHSSPDLTRSKQPTVEYVGRQGSLEATQPRGAAQNREEIDRATVRCVADCSPGTPRITEPASRCFRSSGGTACPVPIRSIANGDRHGDPPMTPDLSTTIRFCAGSPNGNNDQACDPPLRAPERPTQIPLFAGAENREDGVPPVAGKNPPDADMKQYALRWARKGARCTYLARSDEWMRPHCWERVENPELIARIYAIAKRPTGTFLRPVPPSGAN